MSERTLRRRREEFGLPIGSSYTDLSDDALDEVVRDILEVLPNVYCVLIAIHLPNAKVFSLGL